MTSRRILLLTTDLELGGTPTVVRELAIRLRSAAAAPDIHVACLGKWGPVADQLIAENIPVTAIAATRPLDFRALPKLISLIRTHRFDTVFSFLVHANALAAAASLWVRDVCWIQSIQTTQPWPAWHWLVQRLVHRVAEIIVVPSPSVAATASQWSNIPPQKILIIPNAIDPDDFSKSTVPENNPRPYPITFIGRFDPIKDLPTLIAAVGQLGNLVHLHLYGDGRDRLRVDEEIARNDIQDFVTLHGPIDGPNLALQQSGLLVLPSLAEGFGLVLIEAMAARVPVIGTKVPGIRDVIRDGQTGLLVPPRNPAALATAIRQLIQDQPLRLRLVTAAAEDVQTRFTWDIVLDQYQRMLRLK